MKIPEKKTANFSGTFKFFTMFEKKCSGYLIPPRYEIQFLQFLQLFFVDLFFSEKNGLTVCQNFLLSMIFFSFKFTNYCFFFLRRDTQKLHCLAWANLFQSVGFFINLFLKRVLSIIDLNDALVIKGLLFPYMSFFFLGA